MLCHLSTTYKVQHPLGSRCGIFTTTLPKGSQDIYVATTGQNGR